MRRERVSPLGLARGGRARFRTLLPWLMTVVVPLVLAACNNSKGGSGY
jgi:hypothetical protein